MTQPPRTAVSASRDARPARYRCLHGCTRAYCWCRAQTPARAARRPRWRHRRRRAPARRRRLRRLLLLPPPPPSPCLRPRLPPPLPRLPRARRLPPWWCHHPQSISSAVLSSQCRCRRRRRSCVLRWGRVASRALRPCSPRSSSDARESHEDEHDAEHEEPAELQEAQEEAPAAPAPVTPAHRSYSGRREPPTPG
jgi:hypothetical protein